MYQLVEPLNEEFIIVGIRGEMFDNAIQDLESFIRYTTEKYPIDSNKRYLLGFSQGAILSQSVAYLYD